MSTNAWDMKAIITLYEKSNGGLHKPITLPYIGCLISVGSINIDTRVYFERDLVLFPGDSADVKLKFLNAEFASKYLHVGSEFGLVDYREFGRGKIVSVDVSDVTG